MSLLDWGEAPTDVIDQAVRAGVRPNLRDFLDMPPEWREAWVKAVERESATFATLIGLASQGPLPAAFVLAGAGDVGPLEGRMLEEEHARAVQAEEKAPRAKAVGH